MSFELMALAWKVQVEKSADRIVLMALADKANDDGTNCFPSIETLCEMTALNRKTVFAVLSRLSERGLVTISKRTKPYCNQYLLNVDEWQKSSTKNGTTQKRNDPKTELRLSQKRDDSSTKNGTRVVPKTVHEPINNLSITNQLTNQEDVAPWDSDQEQEVQKIEKPKRATQKGTRLTIDVLPDDWRKYCEEHAPDLDPEKAFEDFHDYWVGVPGAKGVKLDWFATWRNFLRGIPDWKRKNFVKSTKPTGRMDTTSAEYLEIYRRGCTYDPNAEPSPTDADGFVAF